MGGGRLAHTVQRLTAYVRWKAARTSSTAAWRRDSVLEAVSERARSPAEGREPGGPGAEGQLLHQLSEDSRAQPGERGYPSRL